MLLRILISCFVVINAASAMDKDFPHRTSLLTRSKSSPALRERICLTPQSNLDTSEFRKDTTTPYIGAFFQDDEFEEELSETSSVDYHESRDPNDVYERNLQLAIESFQVESIASDSALSSSSEDENGWESGSFDFNDASELVDDREDIFQLALQSVRLFSLEEETRNREQEALERRQEEWIQTMLMQVVSSSSSFPPAA